MKMGEAKSDLIYAVVAMLAGGEQHTRRVPKSFRTDGIEITRMTQNIARKHWHAGIPGRRQTASMLTPASASNARPSRNASANCVRSGGQSPSRSYQVRCDREYATHSHERCLRLGAIRTAALGKLSSVIRRSSLWHTSSDSLPLGCHGPTSANGRLTTSFRYPPTSSSPLMIQSSERVGR